MDHISVATLHVLEERVERRTRQYGASGSKLARAQVHARISTFRPHIYPRTEALSHKYITLQYVVLWYWHSSKIWSHYKITGVQIIGELLLQTHTAPSPAASISCYMHECSSRVMSQSSSILIGASLEILEATETTSCDWLTHIGCSIF